MWHVLFGVMQNLMSVKVLVRLFVLKCSSRDNCKYFVYNLRWYIYYTVHTCDIVSFLFL